MILYWDPEFKIKVHWNQFSFQTKSDIFMKTTGVRLKLIMKMT
jgi:hypothetical protein